MNSVDNSASHHHLLLLGKRHVDFLVGSYQSSKIEVTDMRISSAASPAKDIVRMRLFNVGGSLRGGRLAHLTIRCSRGRDGSHASTTIRTRGRNTCRNGRLPTCHKRAHDTIHKGLHPTAAGWRILTRRCGGVFIIAVTHLNGPTKGAHALAS